MSLLHTIFGITGSSGAGTRSAVRVLYRVFKSLGLKAAMIEGDAFHAFDREGNKQAIERARIRGENFSLFGPAGNHLERLQNLLREYGERGSGITRHYLHTQHEAQEWKQAVGTFTPWQRLPAGTDVLFYEGLHGGYIGEGVDIVQHMDLLIGVAPVINLEWIQKIRRDTEERGHQADDVMRTILRRMPDYVTHITPQFSRTDVNFQRVPLVDTSNPFTVREIPSPAESLVVIHFNEGSRLTARIDDLMHQIPGAFKSNDQTLVVPGNEMRHSMELIVAPAIERLIQQRLAHSGKIPSSP